MPDDLENVILQNSNAFDQQWNEDLQSAQRLRKLDLENAETTRQQAEQESLRHVYDTIAAQYQSTGDLAALQSSPIANTRIGQIALNQFTQDIAGRENQNSSIAQSRKQIADIQFDQGVNDAYNQYAANPGATPMEGIDARTWNQARNKYEADQSAYQATLNQRETSALQARQAREQYASAQTVKNLTNQYMEILSRNNWNFDALNAAPGINTIEGRQAVAAIQQDRINNISQDQTIREKLEARVSQNYQKRVLPMGLKAKDAWERGDLQTFAQAVSAMTAYADLPYRLVPTNKGFKVQFRSNQTGDFADLDGQELSYTEGIKLVRALIDGDARQLQGMTGTLAHVNPQYFYIAMKNQINTSSQNAESVLSGGYPVTGPQGEEFRGYTINSTDYAQPPMMEIYDPNTHNIVTTIPINRAHEFGYSVPQQTVGRNVSQEKDSDSSRQFQYTPAMWKEITARAGNTGKITQDKTTGLVTVTWKDEDGNETYWTALPEELAWLGKETQAFLTAPDSNAVAQDGTGPAGQGGPGMAMAAPSSGQGGPGMAMAAPSSGQGGPGMAMAATPGGQGQGPSGPPVAQGLNGAGGDRRNLPGMAANMSGTPRYPQDVYVPDNVIGDAPVQSKPGERPDPRKGLKVLSPNVTGRIARAEGRVPTQKQGKQAYEERQKLRKAKPIIKGTITSGNVPSTVIQVTVDGKKCYAVVPMVDESGNILSKSAIRLAWSKTGKSYGVYEDEDVARLYAREKNKSLSKDRQQKTNGGRGRR